MCGRYIREAKHTAEISVTDPFELERSLDSIQKCYDNLLGLSEAQLRRTLIEFGDDRENWPKDLHEFCRVAYFRMATPSRWLETWTKCAAQLADRSFNDHYVREAMFSSDKFMDVCTCMTDEELQEQIRSADENINDLCARHTDRNRPDLAEIVDPELRPGVKPLQLWKDILTAVLERYNDGEVAAAADDGHLRRPAVVHKATMGCFHLVLKNLNCMGGSLFDKLFYRDFVNAWARPTEGMENWVLTPGDPDSWLRAAPSAIMAQYLCAGAVVLRMKRADASPGDEISVSDSEILEHMEKRAHQQPLVYCFLVFLRLTHVTLMAHESAKAMPHGDFDKFLASGRLSRTHIHANANAYKYVRSGMEYDINCRLASEEEDAINRKLLFTKATKNGQRQPADLMVEKYVNHHRYWFDKFYTPSLPKRLPQIAAVFDDMLRRRQDGRGVRQYQRTERPAITKITRSCYQWAESHKIWELDAPVVDSRGNDIPQDGLWSLGNGSLGKDAVRGNDEFLNLISNGETKVRAYAGKYYLNATELQASRPEESDRTFNAPAQLRSTIQERTDSEYHAKNCAHRALHALCTACSVLHALCSACGVLLTYHSVPVVRCSNNLGGVRHW
jgi:hypothetical protein